MEDRLVKSHWSKLSRVRRIQDTNIFWLFVSSMFTLIAIILLVNFECSLQTVN